MQLVRFIDHDPAEPRWVERDGARAQAIERRRLARLKRIVRDLVIALALVAGLTVATIWFRSGALFLVTLLVNVASLLYLNIRYKPHRH